MFCLTSIVKSTKISNLDFRRFFILEQDLCMSKDEYRKADIDAIKKLSETLEFQRY